MLSILAQERLLGTALGSVFAGVVVHEQRRAISDSISANSSSQSQVLFQNPTFYHILKPKVYVSRMLLCSLRLRISSMHANRRMKATFTAPTLPPWEHDKRFHGELETAIQKLSLSTTASATYFCALDVSEPLFGKKSRQQLAHYWTKAVDQTLGPVIAFLSSRGW
ncbi:hypothetical protein RJ641_008513 [Dillenia turbinata]|uniref:Uncharacterized protein n=1 Tax=Dillenia turbinata TaxID=194707 RepID=A0AAN8V8C6_9MAGN